MEATNEMVGVGISSFLSVMGGSALRAKYRELENDPKVKCKCRKGKRLYDH